MTPTETRPKPNALTQADITCYPSAIATAASAVILSLIPVPSTRVSHRGCPSSFVKRPPWLSPIDHRFFF